MAERQLSDRTLLLQPTTQQTSTQENAFRATEQEEEQARDERWQSVASVLTAEPYEDTSRACPAQSTRLLEHD